MKRKGSFMMAVILLVMCGLPGTLVAQTKLVVLCGITMKPAIEELTASFGRKNNVQFEISYGGSGDLQKLIQANKVGDIFFPGSDSFIKTLQSTGEVLETALAGENKAVLVVVKGNPKNVTSLNDLANPRLKVVLAKASSGSIGRESEAILSTAGLLSDVMDNVLFFTTDSKDLVLAIKNGTADMTINWKAIAALAENRSFMEVIDVPGATAEKLVFGLLKYSTAPAAARSFIQYATSAEGRSVFAKHGF